MLLELMVGEQVLRFSSMTSTMLGTPVDITLSRVRDRIMPSHRRRNRGSALESVPHQRAPEHVAESCSRSASDVTSSVAQLLMGERRRPISHFWRRGWRRDSAVVGGNEDQRRRRGPWRRRRRRRSLPGDPRSRSAGTARFGALRVSARESRCSSADSWGRRRRSADRRSNPGQGQYVTEGGR